MIHNFYLDRNAKNETNGKNYFLLVYPEEIISSSYLFLYDFYVTNIEIKANEAVDFYKKRGTCENYIKESKYDMNVGTMILKSFWANEAIFQI